MDGKVEGHAGSGLLSSESTSMRGSRIRDCAWMPGIGFQRADIHAARTRQVARAPSGSWTFQRAIPEPQITLAGRLPRV